jgi:hypothetical protein
MKQFKAGQKVRVRTWDDMVKEVGEHEVQTIALGIQIINMGKDTFTTTMKDLSGRTHVINDKEAEKGMFFEMSEYTFPYCITPEMCEEVTNEPNP